MVKKIWHDPVLSGVIGAIIYAVLARLISQWWPLPWRSVLAVFAFLGGETYVWNWLLAVLGVVTLIAVFQWAAAIRRRREPWRQYTEDTFNGYKWRWEYDGSKPWNLRCFCPKCDFEITNYFGKNWSDGWTTPRDECPHCKAQIPPLGDKHAVWNSVSLLVEQRIRTGEWAAGKQSG
jgi:hypothetical protein